MGKELRTPFNQTLYLRPDQPGVCDGLSVLWMQSFSASGMYNLPPIATNIAATLHTKLCGMPPFERVEYMNQFFQPALSHFDTKQCFGLDDAVARLMIMDSSVTDILIFAQMTGGDVGHAMGIHKSMFGPEDYYFFDPNEGVYYIDSDAHYDEVADHMKRYAQFNEFYLFQYN